jgi:hypothetical protein
VTLSFVLFLPDGVSWWLNLLGFLCDPTGLSSWPFSGVLTFSRFFPSFHVVLFVVLHTISQAMKVFNNAEPLATALPRTLKKPHINLIDKFLILPWPSTSSSERTSISRRSSGLHRRRLKEWRKVAEEQGFPEQIDGEFTTLGVCCSTS